MPDNPIFDEVAFGRAEIPALAQLDTAHTVAPRTFDDDGSSYTRVSAGEFPSFDEVDSTTIIDEGAPE